MIEIEEKDLMIADRAYGTITNMEHCLKGSGDFIIRIKDKPFNLYDEHEKNSFFGLFENSWQ